MKNKRKARILTLYTLYACDMRPGEHADAILSQVVAEYSYAHEAIIYAKNLIQHFVQKKEQVDGLLQKHTANWDINRMAAIDRNIMRIAITELYYFTDVPFKVVIDEAVEIAKIYGTPDSGKFVNGILDAVYRELSKQNSGNQGG